jgi:hypothetical protein
VGDRYHPRVDACKNPELRATLARNRDEEQEHAAILLEWIRRNDASRNHELHDHVLADKPLTHDCGVDLCIRAVRCGCSSDAHLDRRALERRERGAPGRRRRSGWCMLGGLRLLAHPFGFGFMLVLQALLGAFAVVNGWLVEWPKAPGNAE